jgi:hypothetical protein
MTKKPKSVATILERELDPTVKEWLRRVKGPFRCWGCERATVTIEWLVALGGYDHGVHRVGGDAPWR